MTERDGPASTDAHSSRAQQRKRECAPHASQRTARTQSNCGEIVGWPSVYKKLSPPLPCPRPSGCKDKGN